MGWTCQVAGLEPGVVRARLILLARPMYQCLAPTMAFALFLSLLTPAYGATSYHRFATGLGMNIRHLPCVSRRTGEAGTCMFAYSCAKLNGTHLGTCIDRFYFGSCCRLPQGVSPESLEHVNLEDNFIEDNSIATSENPIPPQQVKPSYPSSSTTSTIRIPPTTAGYVTSTNPSSSSQRPPSSTYPSSQLPTQNIITTRYPITTSRPQTSPTTPAPTLVTWTTIDGFPPRKPPSVGSSVSPLSSTTHRTPVSSSTVIVAQTKPTSVFNTTYGTITITSPKPSSPLPSSSSKPSVTIISSPKPSQRPSTVTRPQSSTSSKPIIPVITDRPTTVIISKPPSQRPIPTRPSPKPTTRPSKPSTKPPVKITSKPTTKPVTSVTIISSERPSSPKPTKPIKIGTTPTKPSSTQKPSTLTPSKPSSVKPTSSKPVVKPSTKPTPKPTRPKPTKPTKPSTTQKPTTKPTIPSTTRPQTTTAEPSTDPDWVQVSVSSHEPSLPTTIFLTTESPWTSRPGVTEVNTYPVTITTEIPTFPTAPGPSSSSGASTVYLSTTTTSPTFLPPVDSNEILNINMSDFKDVCGRRLFPEPRIVGGNKSTFGKWPWQISLRQWRTSTYLHKCGAALLSENWAITAAHCVENVPPSDLLLRLGEYDLSTEEEPYTFQERRVQIVASHPQFDPRTFEYDLALLRFYDPVQFQPNIIPICVPEDDTNFVGRTAYVTGWGRLYEDGPLPMVLQEVSVPVINNTVCETMYRAAGYIEHIPDIFICAGWKKGGFDSCEGDSGGPMVIERPGDKRWMLAGVISWGIGCAEPNQPGVYTRISHFRHWINQILQF